MKRVILGIVWLVGVASFVMALEEEDTEESVLQQVSMRLLETNELVKEYKIVTNAIKRAVKLRQPEGCLERVIKVIREPFYLETFTLSLKDELSTTVKDGNLQHLPALFSMASNVIDFEMEPADAAVVFTTEDVLNDPMLIIEKSLDLAARFREEALSELTEEEKTTAYEVISEILDKFIDHVYLEVDAKPDQLQRFGEGLKILEKIRLDKMGASAVVLSGLTRSDCLQAFQKAFAKYKEKVPREAKKAGFSGDLIAYRETKHGPIVIGGKKKTSYKGKAAFILDLGGNDTYSFAASTLDSDRGLSMVIDMDGKDKYVGKKPESIAASRLGVSLLIDLKGNDQYEGTRITQGFGAGGVTLLWDQDGKDQYKGEEYAQGGGFFGIGLLIDVVGKDTFNSYLYSQGFGLSRGFGALVDVDGDDEFIATGKYPCTYGQKGIFHAVSQGHGTGLRRAKNQEAPTYGGGIGLLLDVAGDDRYDAGNFSQGCGYYYGCGMIVDQSGDDEIIGSRYSQGTGAHQAAGILINGDGNDTYKSTVAANQAGTWDTTVGMLLDYQGDDSYVAQDLAQAGAAQNAFALLYDGQGKDSYHANNKDCQGGTGSFDYHDKPSMAIFLDVGGGKDTYNRPGRKNNTILLEKWFGVFADFKQRDLEGVLKLSPKKLTGDWGKREK